MGNFSRDTFNKLKHYVGVRLQQGVPIVDADWNELEDIRKYELRTFLKWFVSNGVPKGNDGFRIVSIDSYSDFVIKGGDDTPEEAGHCLVEGWDAMNESDIKYTEQPLYENAALAAKWRVHPVHPLTLPEEELIWPSVYRTDTVYLDVWEREVDSEEDPELKNEEAIGLETCVRLKCEWAVRVAEGVTTPPAPPTDHFFYSLAHLNRPGTAYNEAGMLMSPADPVIRTAYIKDLRRTGLAVLSEEITIENGNVGIGTASPSVPLEVNSKEGDKGLIIGRQGKSTKVYFHVAGGDYGYLALGGDTHLRGNGQPSSFEGNVGIGTTSPEYKLDVPTGWFRFGPGGDGGRIFAEYGSQYAPLLKLSDKDDPPRIQFQQIGNQSEEAPQFASWIGHAKSQSSDIAIMGGNVGIGTTDPGTDMLDVRGRCYSQGGWHLWNADYAEYLESQNGSAISAGTSVVFTQEGKIRAARKGEIPFGVITSNPAIIGNHSKEWPKKYLRDEFGVQIMEEYQEEIMAPRKEKVKKERQKVTKKKSEEEVTRTEVVYKGRKYRQVEITETVAREVEEPVFEEVDLYDAAGKEVIGKHLVPVMETYEEEIEVLDGNGVPVMVGTGEFVKRERPKLNPDYDGSKEYVAREDRPEWNCVGLLGQLLLRKGQPVAPTWVKIKDVSEKIELWLVK